MTKTILLTGGAGFVGSHTLISLSKANYECIIIDNLANSCVEVIENCEKITNKKIKFFNVNLLDNEKLCTVFKNNKIDLVIHFAALKSVGDSVKFPLVYYHNNLTGTLNLLRAMETYDVKNIVFSSSCTVYGDPKYLPIDEKHPIGESTNPYGTSKYFVEVIIRDTIKNLGGNYIHLRYFNPVGAHESGIIGESPLGTPNNLFPIIADVAIGKRESMNVFGNTYDTIDGTGVRDYIHVVDLADGHTKAVDYIFQNKVVQKAYNLGTGQGYSVLQVIQEYEKVCGKKINYKFVEKRAGDIARNFADCSLAQKDLGWSSKYGLKEMCEHSWNFICHQKAK